MINNRQLERLVEHIQKVNAKKYLEWYVSIVMQVPEEYVCRAIPLQAKIRNLLADEQPPANIYLLFDCNKKSCCTDIIGAKHVNYDLLVHFGEACFSEEYDKRHYYILPEAEDLEEVIMAAAKKTE